MKMKIDLHYGMDPPFGPSTHEEEGIGGTENFITYSAEYLSRAGHQVRVFNKIQSPIQDWYPLDHFEPDEDRDVLMSFRTREVFEQRPNARLKVIALADTESHGLGDAVRDRLIDLVMFVGQWQAHKIASEENIPPERYVVTSNGVSMARFDALRKQAPHSPGKCVHLSTPERGLSPLLDVWPAIQEAVPNARLNLFSSFLGWRMSDDDNADMCRDIYQRVKNLQEAGYQIINWQHVNAAQMRHHLLSARLFLYPTRHFNETCCISAIEAAAAGVPIVATARAALMERVRHEETGYLVGGEGEEHDAYFIKRAVHLLKDDDTWSKFSAQSVEMARLYDYANLVNEWIQRWSSEITLRG